MIFTSKRVLNEWKQGGLDPNLYMLLAWVWPLHWRLTGKPPCVTNIRRDLGTTTTHSEGRAVDLRTVGQGRYVPGDLLAKRSGTRWLSMEVALKIEQRINAAWSLGAVFAGGAEMMPAVAHVGTAHHIHLQVARNGVLVPRSAPVVDTEPPTGGTEE